MKHCLNCNTEIPYRQKYCSQSCKLDYEYKQYIERWKNGLESGKRGEYQISRHIRKYLLDKYNYKCSKCGWGEINPYTNNVPLEIDHIDGNYNNNSEDNLIVLCPNCHSLTSTYKGANKGNGRKERSKYNL